MAAVKGGDREAFRELFRRFVPLLYSIARPHVHSDDDAREIVQQALFRAYVARRDFREGARVKPWLTTIARNLVRDFHRRRRRRPESPLLGVDPPAPPVGASLSLERQAARVREAVATLPVGQRRAIELHYFERRPFADVARELGTTEGAARVRAHRAYGKLRALLGGEA
jgi:RNA polymerase sigma-70 factor (ECF subfamily)